MLSDRELGAALARLPGRPATWTAYRVIPACFYPTALSTVGSCQRGGRYNPRGQLEALRAPSAKDPSATNLVIFPDALQPASTLRVFDDSGFIDASLP